MGANRKTKSHIKFSDMKTELNEWFTLDGNGTQRAILFNLSFNNEVNISSSDFHKYLWVS